MSKSTNVAEPSNSKRAGLIAKLGRVVAFGGLIAAPAIGYAQSGPPGPPADEGRGDLANVHVACAADANRFCKDAKVGHGHVRACLKAHEADLSDGCKAALQEAREHHHPHR
jgi:Cysteine rich repeat